MKKLISIFLCLIMVSSVASLAAAENILDSDTILEIENAEQGIADWYSNYDTQFGEWDVIALGSVGIQDIRFENVVGDDIWTQNIAEYIETGNYAKLSLSVLALLAAGKSPDTVCASFSTMPSDVIAKSQNEDGSFGESGYLTDAIYAIIVLENTRPNGYRRDAAVSYMLSQQCDDGGYTFFGDVGDVDMTGMALLALGFYKGVPDVDVAIDGAVSFLYDNMTDNGGYISAWSTEGAENSNSVAAAISGLIAVGGERVFESDRYIEMAKNLLSFSAADGGFVYEAIDEESNWFASYQALLALGDLKNQESYFSRLNWVSIESEALSRYIDSDDISDSARAILAQLTRDGVLIGNDDATFAPKRELTRAELATVIARIDGGKPVVEETHTYSDINPDAWYAGAVLAAADKGYLEAIDGRILPDKHATLEEIALAVAKLCSIDTEGDYWDALINQGIIDSDYSDRKDSTVKREEASRILFLAKQVIDDANNE